MQEPGIIEILLEICITLCAAAAKSLQSCPTLCDPIDGIPPGPAVPGILQARTLEWVAISSSNAWEWKVKVKSLSPVRLLATPWTAAYQAPPSRGFSRQEYWSGLPLGGHLSKTQNALSCFYHPQFPWWLCWKFPFNPLYNWMLSDCLCSAGFLFFNRSKGKLILQTNSKF